MTDVVTKDPVIELPEPGYHLKKIEKGKIGELSKVMEELEEALDAESQGSKIMTLLELSDLIGALKRYLERHHQGTRLEDLEKMADITRRAFENGHR